MPLLRLRISVKGQVGSAIKCSTKVVLPELTVALAFPVEPVVASAPEPPAGAKPPVGGLLGAVGGLGVAGVGFPVDIVWEKKSYE